jgi:hypothetical protein
MQHQRTSISNNKMNGENIHFSKKKKKKKIENLFPIY